MTSDPRPRRLLEWRDEAGRAVVLRPKFGRGRLGRWLAGRLRDPYYRIRLDEVGTLVWQACDGRTPLSDIARRMRARFGERAEPVEQRLALFVRRMVRARLIEL